MNVHSTNVSSLDLDHQWHCFVEDSGTAALKQEDVETFVKELRNKGFDWEIECDFTKCTGIGMEELDDGTRHVTQKGPIKKIVENMK